MLQGDVHDAKIELMPRKQLTELQVERLRRQLSYVYGCSSFYRNKFDKAGVKPEQIKSKEDMENIPPTTAEEIFREMERTGDYRAGLLCVPYSEVYAETGPQEFPSLAKQYPDHPVFALRTMGDVDMTDTLVARCWRMMGVKPNQLVLVSSFIWEVLSYSLDPQVCWPLAGASSKIGVTTVTLDTFPDSDIGGILAEVLCKDRTLPIMWLKPNAIFINSIGMKRIFGWYPDKLPLSEKIGTSVVGIQENVILGAAERKDLSEGIGFEPYSILNMQNPAFYASECPQRKGVHVYEDYFLVEAVGEDGKRKAPGEVGKLAITNLYLQAMPLIRYLTDIDVFLDEEVCPCARTHVRMLTPEYKS